MDTSKALHGSAVFVMQHRQTIPLMLVPFDALLHRGYNVDHATRYCASRTNEASAIYTWNCSSKGGTDEHVEPRLYTVKG